VESIIKSDGLLGIKVAMPKFQLQLTIFVAENYRIR